jgi:hypothetical protein
MAQGSGRRKTAPKKAFIGPLVMLAGGVAAGVVIWRVLMLDPAPRWQSVEQLSRQDREALERVLTAHP